MSTDVHMVSIMLIVHDRASTMVWSWFGEIARTVVTVEDVQVCRYQFCQQEFVLGQLALCRCFQEFHHCFVRRKHLEVQSTPLLRITAVTKTPDRWGCSRCAKVYLMNLANLGSKSGLVKLRIFCDFGNPGGIWCLGKLPDSYLVPVYTHHVAVTGIMSTRPRCCEMSWLT